MSRRNETENIREVDEIQMDRKRSRRRCKDTVIKDTKAWQISERKNGNITARPATSHMETATDGQNVSIATLRPQSHRIVRFLDRTIGCDLANVQPIGNVCYDLQVAYCDRSFLLVVGHRTIGRTHGRAINTDCRISMARSTIS